MNNNNKQELTLIVVLTVAFVTGLILVGLKLQDAKVKSIEQTVTHSLEEMRDEE